MVKQGAVRVFGVSAARVVLTAVSAIVVGALLAGPTWAAAGTSCGRFVIGEANSTSYADGELPARGVATRTSCVTLKRIARRLHDGTYPVPDGAGRPAPGWGEAFTVRDRGRRWSCRLQNIGASGPSYAMRCKRRAAALRWTTG